MSTQQFQGPVEMLDVVDLKGNAEGLAGVRRRVEAVTNAAAVTRTLKTSESGMLFTITATTVDNNIAFTLPTASESAGTYYDFCILANSDDDADVSWSTGANGTDIYGGIIRGAANSTVLDVDGLSKVILDGSASQAVEGTRLTFLCDGTNWHLSGYCPVAVGTAVITESASA